MHVAQATACTMAFVVVSCQSRELLRTVVRTEPEWTFGDLYAYTSRRQSTSERSEVFSLVDVKISSDGKTDWATVELQQPVEVCSIFQKQYVLFRVVREPGTTSTPQINSCSLLMPNARYMRSLLHTMFCTVTYCSPDLFLYKTFWS